MAINLEQLIADIESASILELNEVVKALEEKFGVSAAAGAVVVAAGGAAAAEAEEEKTEFDLILKEFPADAKIKIIKVVRELTGLGLKEAKELVESAPKAIKEGISKEDCEKIAEQFKEAGAVMEIK